MSYGAGGRTRTDMPLRAPDFESGAYTNFATPAEVNGYDKRQGTQSSNLAGIRASRRGANERVCHLNNWR